MDYSFEDRCDKILDEMAKAYMRTPISNFTFNTHPEIREAEFSALRHDGFILGDNPIRITDKGVAFAASSDSYVRRAKKRDVEELLLNNHVYLTNAQKTWNRVTIGIAALSLMVSFCSIIRDKPTQIQMLPKQLQKSIVQDTLIYHDTVWQIPQTQVDIKHH